MKEMVLSRDHNGYLLLVGFSPVRRPVYVGFCIHRLISRVNLVLIRFC
jgi:hypothetical protein